MKPRIKTSWGKEEYDLSIWDLVKVNQEGNIVLSSEFFSDVLSCSFLTNKEYKIINNNLSELKKELSEIINLKKEWVEVKSEISKELSELRKLKDKKANEINMEIAEFENNISKTKKENDNYLDNSKKEINSFIEKCKNELHKKFILELGKPITDKNKSVKETLKEFYVKLSKGIDDYRQRDIFINKFKEVIANLNLETKTKDNFLKICSEDSWNRDNNKFEKEWSNEKLCKILERIIDKISVGYDSELIRLNIDSLGKISISEIEKPSNKKSVNDNQDILTNQNDDVDDVEDYGKGDLYGN